MKIKAIFPGTFDPFTKGHESLLKRSLLLVDEIVVAIGVNNAKDCYFSLEKRMEMIQALYEEDDRVSVASYVGLTVDFAREVGASFIVRGLRSVKDFEYEKEISDINRDISDIETIVLFTESKYSHISSTIVRDLLRYNRDISRFIPDGMKLFLEKGI